MWIRKTVFLFTTLFVAHRKETIVHYLKLRVAVAGEPADVIDVLTHENPIDRQWVVDVLASQNVTEADFFGPPREYTPVEMEAITQEEFDALYERATTIPDNTMVVTNLATEEAMFAWIPEPPYNTKDFPAWNHYFKGYEKR